MSEDKMESVELIHSTDFSTIKSDTFFKSGVKAGAYAGFVLSLITIIFKELSGFGELVFTEFMILWPTMIFSGTVAGTIFAALCCKYAQLFHARSSGFTQKTFLTILSIIGFFITAIVHQLPARDALIPAGTFAFENRMGGGPLGEPNFETLATGILGGTFFASQAVYLARESTYNKKDILQTCVRIYLPSIILWCAVYLIYSILIILGVLQYMSIPWKSSAIFIIEFAHPERVILHIFFCFIYSSFLILTILKDLPKPQISKEEQELLDKTHKILQENMANELFNINDFATDLGWSRRQLYRKIKELTGSTPEKLIINFRLKQATQLIASTGYTISEIAFKTGFKNPAHLAKIFREHYSLSPTEYRNKYQK